MSVLALLLAAAPLPSGWTVWTERALAIAEAEERGGPDDGEEPVVLKAACATAARPLPAGLPGWTEALQPWCRAVVAMKTLGEPRIPEWRARCRAGRRALALLEQARAVAAEPRALPVARRLAARWRAEYAASCPARIPPPGYPG
jgi:hypothetical protein